MTNQDIISKINIYLHESASLLVSWLESILPRVSDSWWQNCALSSLSFTQKEIAESKGFTKLSDFDLAALLRIANKSWYDMRNVAYLPTSEREVVREMMNVRNNWAHCSADIPGKDTIIHDLNTISTFIIQVGGNPSISNSIHDFITELEAPGAITSPSLREEATQSPSEGTNIDNTIKEKSLVYLVSEPDKRGIVYRITDLGTVTKYDVFIDNALQTFYSGQIASVEETAGYEWVDLDSVRSHLTAYQINNPSAQNLYSLNTARIDFVPYQFRPALKLIHSDTPRILIADSVGVGKTIEAGLIIKELEARHDLAHVAIICPRPLVAERKWELEMKRFDEEFIPIDGPAFRQAISDTDRDGEWPARFSKIIIPYSIMDSRIYGGNKKNNDLPFGLDDLDPAPHFDLVIVDEAHHIRNGSMDKEKAFAYKCTKYFCDHADAVVMLTATPLQTGDDDLFTLLNVLRPDVVIDKKTFSVMSRPNEFISQAARFVRSSAPDWASNALDALTQVPKTQWGQYVISENPLFEDILIRLENDSFTREERVQLISDIESLHSFGTMLNRTRRRDIQDFCVRRSHTISTYFTDYQQTLHDELLNFERTALSTLHNPRSVPFMMSTIKRQAASCIFGLAPHMRDIIERRIQQMNDDPEVDYSDFSFDGTSMDALSSIAKRVLDLADALPEEDPKLDAVLSIIEQKQQFENNKIMVFSTFRHTLFYLKRKLLESGYRVENIDGSVKDEQRYALKARFEKPRTDSDALDILLFTEVGSEGLDYQFCDMMINYDLPWNPMRIEQRIGRIDRRGQRSEAVNIYNIITENTVDADIYYRCLSRIGVFENSIGECEEILGAIASGIEAIAVDSSLTKAERERKLEQIADNEVRKIQEINRLEEEEKELFGFDLTEFTTSQEIRRAENPWITQKRLQSLVEKYLNARVGNGTYIIGEGSLKNLRLPVAAREMMREDSRNLPGGRNALKRTWENYLIGRAPNHAITFDPETASSNRDSFFITSMHPLARQAASYFSGSAPSYLNLLYYSETLPAGTFTFSVYAWKYTGFNTHTRLITVCENETISKELPDILDSASNASGSSGTGFDWDPLEGRQVQMWMAAKDDYRKDIAKTTTFKLESLANTERNRIRTLEQQMNDSYDEQIRRMRKSELESVTERYQMKVDEIRQTAERADIYSRLLVNGVITVLEA